MNSLYVAQAKNEADKICSEDFYRKIFNNYYNLDFHMPKKDQCDDCVAYKNMTDENKQEVKNDYELHIKNKNTARNWMNEDKRLAKNNSSMCATTFDLEKVLTMPRSESATMYYKRKISLYNFTIYDLATQEGSCFVWDETIAKRGANEIASCVWYYINKQIIIEKKSFHFYSDNCGGQNRNNILFTMYAKASRDFNVSITHRYCKSINSYAILIELLNN